MCMPSVSGPVETTRSLAQRAVLVALEQPELEQRLERLLGLARLDLRQQRGASTPGLRGTRARDELAQRGQVPRRVVRGLRDLELMGAAIAAEREQPRVRRVALLGAARLVELDELLEVLGRLAREPARRGEAPAIVGVRLRWPAITSLR